MISIGCGFSVEFGLFAGWMDERVDDLSLLSIRIYRKITRNLFVRMVLISAEGIADMDIVVCLVGYLDVCQLIAVVHPRRFICIQLADEPNTAGRLVGGDCWVDQCGICVHE